MALFNDRRKGLTNVGPPTVQVEAQLHLFGGRVTMKRPLATRKLEKTRTALTPPYPS